MRGAGYSQLREWACVKHGSSPPQLPTRWHLLCGPLGPRRRDRPLTPPDWVPPLHPPAALRTRGACSLLALALRSASLAVQRFSGRRGNQSAHAQSVTLPGAGLVGAPPRCVRTDHVGSGPAAESGAAAARTGGGTGFGDCAACCRYCARAFSAPLPALATPPGTPTLGNAPHTPLRVP